MQCFYSTLSQLTPTVVLNHTYGLYNECCYHNYTNNYQTPLKIWRLHPFALIVDHFLGYQRASIGQ